MIGSQIYKSHPKGGGIEGETRLTMPYRGWDLQTIQHKHFGPDFVSVYALRLTPPEKDKG